ncbi:MAG: AAA family ATPase [Acidobacteriaceae bacterium]|nr:AAA family ATPase [Acidobacteriaceae bacterium]
MASSPFVVDTLRKRLWANGFRPIAVITDDKRPMGMGWVARARQPVPEAANQWPNAQALSTGILCDGLVVVDIDADDPTIAASILTLARQHLGLAPRRTRANSARCLLLYRAAEGEPRKQTINSDMGKVEILGYGQQFVAFGNHTSGVPYEWEGGHDPSTFPLSKAPVVTPEAVAAFVASAAALLGAEVAAIPPTPLAASEEQKAGMIEISDSDREYASAALQAEVTRLSMLKPGNGRNAALNTAAHSMGTIIGNGSLDLAAVANALFEASIANGHVSKHGEAQTRATIKSGINAGIGKPRALPSQGGSGIDLSGIDSVPLKQGKDKARTKRGVELTSMAEIEAKPIEWLWDGYLPKGKLTLLAGDGGTGKSTIAFSLAATIATAGQWPDGTLCNRHGNVIIWSSEDDPADTIKPRLMAMGADSARCSIISGAVDENGQRQAFDPSCDIDALRSAVASIGGVSLLIIDPIVTAVQGDMHKANDVRRGLQTIVDFAAEMNCAVLGITHFAKGTAGRNSADRVIGSQAFAAFARMVWAAAKEEDSDRRVFTRAKSNNSPDTGGFSYIIEQVALANGITASRIVWGDALEGSSRSILAEVEEGLSKDNTQLGKAERFLLESLAHGPVPQRELMEHARELHSISANTLRRAKDKLGIEPRKNGMAGGWHWQLPNDLLKLQIPVVPAIPYIQ